jgi:hypothetical protein
MEDLIVRLHDAVVDRLHGPLKFRFLMQPAMAAIFAIRAGLADGRAGRPAFLWTVFTKPESRAYLLKDGWKDVAKVFVVAFIMDMIYQYMVTRHVRPLRALLVAAVLCFIPYLFIRGPVSRIFRRSSQ